MRKKEVIVIDAPVADQGDVVDVLNYRRRPAVWEAGTVTDLKYEKMHGPFRWSYSVHVQTKDGKSGYHLFVGDDRIRRI